MENGNHELWGKIKTAMVVVSITLLIWLAADQNVAVEEEFQLKVRLAGDNPDRYAGFASPPYQREFIVKLKGRRNRLREFRRASESGEPLLATIDRSMPTSSSPRPVSVSEEILSGIKEIRESRLTVSSVEPETADVIVDKYTTIRDVRVRPDYGENKVTPEFLRATVSVRLPRFAAKMMHDAPIAVAVPKQSVRSVMRPDGSFEVSGILRFDELDKLDPHMRLEFIPSNEVMIVGRIEALTATESKGPVQINWAVPDEVQRDYAIVTDQANFRVYIDVTGPRERLAQLDPRQIRAFVDVLAGDVDNPGPNKEIAREVRFILPPEFPDCSIAPSSQPPTIRFRLEPRPRGTVTGATGALPSE